MARLNLERPTARIGKPGTTLFACPDCSAPMAPGTLPGVDFCKRCQAAMYLWPEGNRHASRRLSADELQRLCRIEDYGEIRSSADLASIITRRPPPRVTVRRTRRALVEFWAMCAFLLVAAGLGYFLMIQGFGSP